MVIALVNHKGGVGKTTCTLNIGAGLRHMGKSVLLIDADAQANLTTSVGLGYVELPSKLSELAQTRFASGKVGSIFAVGGSQVGISLEDLLKRETSGS